MKLQTGKIITMHILLNISRRKGSQAIKFGQLKFERRFLFLKISGFFFFFFDILIPFEQIFSVNI